jgi:hypothetical protein
LAASIRKKRRENLNKIAQITCAKTSKPITRPMMGFSILWLAENQMEAPAEIPCFT